MNKVLVVIDMQKKFIKQIGAEAIAPKAAAKIEKRIQEGYEILVTFDESGGELDKNIVKLCNGKKVFKKRSYGCRELTEYLYDKSPDAVEFIGICTDICVITNVLSTITFLPFADVTVDGSCCAAGNKSLHDCALKIMKSCNIKVI